jgi:hypothetical protein
VTDVCAAEVESVSAGAQNQPARGAIIEFKTSHFDAREILPLRDQANRADSIPLWQISSKWPTFNRYSRYTSGDGLHGESVASWASTAKPSTGIFGGQVRQARREQSQNQPVKFLKRPPGKTRRKGPVWPTRRAGRWAGTRLHQPMARQTRPVLRPSGRKRPDRGWAGPITIDRHEPAGKHPPAGTGWSEPGGGASARRSGR